MSHVLEYLKALHKLSVDEKFRKTMQIVYFKKSEPKTGVDSGFFPRSSYVCFCLLVGGGVSKSIKSFLSLLF